MKITLPDWVKRAQRTRQDDERVERRERVLKRVGFYSSPARACRKDGSSYTKPSIDARRAANRRRNRCARVARRFNRKENR